MSRCRRCSQGSRVPACLHGVKSVSCFDQVPSTRGHTSLILSSKSAEDSRTERLRAIGGSFWKTCRETQATSKGMTCGFYVCSFFDVKERVVEVFS